MSPILDYTKAILENDVLSCNEKAILICLASHRDGMGEAHISYTRLALECGLSRRSIARAVSRLAKEKWFSFSEGTYFLSDAKFAHIDAKSAHDGAKTAQSDAKSAYRYRPRSSTDKRRVEISREDLKLLLGLLSEKDRQLTILYEADNAPLTLQQIDRYGDLADQLQEFLEIRFVSEKRKAT